MNSANAHLFLPLAEALANGTELICLTPANAAAFVPLIKHVAAGGAIKVNRGTAEAPSWEDPSVTGEVLFACEPHLYRMEFNEPA